MGLKVFHSNRLEILAGKLAETLRVPPKSPIEPEIIIVQSKGMERWISLQLASLHGICSNIKFLFPNTFVADLFQSAGIETERKAEFDPEKMCWKITKLLPSFVDKPGFESINYYLKNTDGNLKRYQLAEKIANVFDQYLIFRPKWIFDWEAGKENHWQSIIWRALLKDSDGNHIAGMRAKFFEKINSSDFDVTVFPKRISVFGITTLPKFHMGVLGSVSQYTRVNLFLMNPCKEYWGDILQQKTAEKIISKSKRKDITAKELHYAEGNKLLASMGKLGRDFFDLVTGLGGEDESLFYESGTRLLLHHIQSDILNLRNNLKETDEKTILSVGDDSIQINSCHSPMREVEVLQDNLLNMFKNNSGLLPKDIIVMTPDIEIYAPYINAVFDLPIDDPRRIPFSIADRSIKKENRIIENFIELLDLTNSRVGASQVLSLLESSTVRNKFELSVNDLEMINQWVKDTHIRWGIDEFHRTEMNLPAFPENTWKTGIERMLLGYALPGNDEKIFGGILPYDNIEGSDSEVLGRFIEFTDLLFKKIEQIKQNRSLDQWAEILLEILNEFFMPDESTENEIQFIRSLLNSLKELRIATGFNKQIEIEVIKYYLAERVGREGFGYGFLTGGITFCSMLPARSIPFKIVCLIGTNGDAYPRQTKPLDFDLMAKHPERGDRSRRIDDRYLFLETLQSAREVFYISFVGQNIRDNSIIPPSVLVCELIDYIEEGFKIKEIDNIINEHFLNMHHLQAFSPEYFRKDSKHFSYSRGNFYAANQILKTRSIAPQFISKGLSVPGDEMKTVQLEDLVGFYRNPTKFLLNKRLGIYLEENAELLEDTERFKLEGLEKYTLDQDLLQQMLEGKDADEFLILKKKQGILPPGIMGNIAYENSINGIKQFAANVKTYLRGEQLEPIDVNITIDDYKLTGRVDNIYTNGLFHYRYAKEKVKDHLRIWVYHLALQQYAGNEKPVESIFACMGEKSNWTAWKYLPVENSRTILKHLLDIYWEGLIKPAHFFPESSFRFAELIIGKNKDRTEALEKARYVWAGDFSRGESEDIYFTLCFGNIDPLDTEFEELSLVILVPIFSTREKL